MIAAVLRRHRPLLALCACSACAHLAVLGWIGARMPRPVPAIVGRTDALRLTLAAASVPAAHGAADAGPASATPAAPAAPAHTVADMPGAAPAAAASSAAAPERLDTPVPASASGAAEPEPAQASALQSAGVRLVQMPGRYRVRAPGPAALRYAVVSEVPGAPPAPAGDAWLDWHTDGAGYRLGMDGVLGRLDSEGVHGDAGLAPRRATERRAGRTLFTTFDAAAGEVRFDVGTSIPDSTGIQDRASLLLQLAGIGLGDPDQMKDVLEVVVAGAGEAAIARLRVLGLERIDTGIGAVDAWHLAGMVAPGHPRLDVWLAPAYDWLPVRVRTSGPDGAATQTLSAMGPGTTTR